jgi:hypothetical protein
LHHAHLFHVELRLEKGAAIAEMALLVVDWRLSPSVYSPLIPVT